MENHAKKIFNFIEQENPEEGTAQQIIAEIDGSLIPVVDTAIPREGKADKRRNRSLRWQEARLCLARGAKLITPVFYATLGGVERAGDLLYKAALKVGFGTKTKVHGMGDGARWIEDQMARIFGNQVKYLVDFYHVSEYLAQAAEHSWTSQKMNWRHAQQELLKQNKWQAVLETIRKRLPMDFEAQQESKKAKKKSKENLIEGKVEETPLEKCYRYIKNRQNNLDYKGAIEQGLPIGSGEIESGHRYVIQKDLK